jgi:CubicO group peptidase (beta-lactamase class C family)
MRLRDAGRLDLDDPVVWWLPELRRAASPAGPAEAAIMPARVITAGSLAQVN